jgi:subfamily B ATP-binding cassette protein MsbA
VTLSEYLRVSHRLGLPASSLGLAVLLSIVATLFESLGLMVVVPVYDYVSAAGDLSGVMEREYWRHIFALAAALNLKVSLSLLLGFAFVMIIIRQAASYARNIVVAAAREKLNRSVRERLFSAFLQASVVEQERSSKGDIVNDLTMELQRFSASLLGFVSLINAVVLGVVYAVILFWISWEMTLASVVVMSAGSYPLRSIWRRTTTAGQKSTDANAHMSRFLFERLQSVRLIRLSGTEVAEVGNLRRFTRRQQETMMQVEKLQASAAVIVEPIVLGLTFVLLILSVEVLHIPMQELALFLMVVLRLLPVMKDVMKGRQLVLACAGSAAALDRRLSRLEAAKERDTGVGGFRTLSHGIRFEAVTYQYPNANRPALKDIDLLLPAGRISVIIGASGAGKSTLIDLLPRLRQPQSGRIFLDDRPIETLTLDSLRRAIAYVPQAPQIYNVTVAEHIRFGDPDASDEAIRDAARLAGAADFIERLPEKYGTLLGEGGGRLSGGQRQRLDLARAVARNAPILILDEPTSNLDSDSEQAFAAALQRLNQERGITILIVAHRERTIRIAQHIVVLEDGRVAESGSPDDLQKRLPKIENVFASRLSDSRNELKS